MHRSAQFVLGLLAGGLMMFVGVCLGGAGSRQDEPPQELRARSIEIVDELGTVRLALGLNRHGGSVSVRDAFGRTMLLLSVSEHGGMLVANEVRGGTPTLIAGASASGPQVMLQHDEHSPLVRLSGAAGAGVIETLADGQTQARIDASSARQGRVTTYGPNGSELVSLTASAENEGQIYTLSGGEPLIALASGAHGPALRLFNRSGASIISLDADPSGSGEIGVWHEDGTGTTITADAAEDDGASPRPAASDQSAPSSSGS